MQRPDEELLDFDTGELEDWDEERTRAAVDGEHGWDTAAFLRQTYYLP